MCGGYNCISTGISPWEKTVLKFTKMEEKAMNTKKITALALAALMAAGSTSTVFAAVDSSNKDKVLEFADFRPARPTTRRMTTVCW